jgi:hypothetical protein
MEKLLCIQSLGFHTGASAAKTLTIILSIVVRGLAAEAAIWIIIIALQNGGKKMNK